MSDDVTIDVDGSAMPCAVARPAAAPRGAIVVIQEAFGVNAHIADVCRRFAAERWLAIAPALFHREGSPVYAYDDLASVMPTMMALTAGGIAADLDATFAWVAAAGIPTSRTAITGFCMGGTVTFVAATRYELGAAVTFYGGGVAQGRFGFASCIELAPSLRTPWLGLYGDRDAGIPVDDVEALRAAVAASGVPAEIVRYPEAEHGFHCDERPSYHPTAAADAWRRTLAWLERFIA